MRLRPGQHLRRQSDIRDVRQQGVRLDCRAFTVWWLPRSPEGRPAPGLLRRLDPGRRQGRPAQPRQAPDAGDFSPAPGICFPPSCDLMLVARSQVNNWPFAQLDRAFTDACGRMASTLRLQDAMTSENISPSAPDPGITANAARGPYQDLPAHRLAAASGACSGPSCGCRFHPSCSHYAAEAVPGPWSPQGRLARGTAADQVHALFTRAGTTPCRLP